MVRELTVNFLGPASLLHALVPAVQHGTVAVIGSVAGDRGRQSNYVYGAAKGGLRVFAQGNAPPPGWQRGGRGAGAARLRGHADDGAPGQGRPALGHAGQGWRPTSTGAMNRGGPAILYTPWFWRWIMLVIRLVPEPVFRRTKL